MTIIKFLIVLSVVVHKSSLLQASNNFIDDDKDEDLELHKSLGKAFESLVDNSSLYSLDNAHKNLTEKSKTNNLIQLVRIQLKKEIRKLKSTITDSIMEEVINYYGKKLEMTDVLKSDYDNLLKKYNLLSQNLNQLGQNFKTISKNHRNLVDIVRNNILTSKKEAEKSKSMTYNNSNLKKKSIDSNRIGNYSSATLTTTTTIGTILNKIQPNDLAKNKLKLELLNDLETKYSNLFDDNLADVLLKNLKNESATDSRKLTIRHDDHKINLNENESVTNTQSTLFVHISSTNKNSIRQDLVFEKLPNDCEDFKNKNNNKNGIFKVNIKNTNNSFDVYCEFEDDIGWTVLQNRNDGSVNFHQNWKSYKNGFGDLEGEFWLGLENMHLLTSQLNYTLQVVMTDWKDEKYIAEYGTFKIDDEKSKYKLELSDYLKNVSNAGDSLGDSSNNGQGHNKMAFSTYDSDNDMRFYDNCAQIFKSGWWFNACFQSNLNGIYYRYSNPNNHSKNVKKDENSQLRFLRNGIHWNTIDFYKSLKSTKLRIRRREN